MGKQYIVKGAMAQCNQSKVPMIAQLNLIPDNMFVNMNGNPVATTMTLGPVFGPAPFGICNMIPPTPAVPTPPCVCAILSWSGADTAVKINMVSSPLTKDSKGTCALGGSISFKMTGQFPKPSIPPIPTPAVPDMNAAAPKPKPAPKKKKALPPHEEEPMKALPPHEEAPTPTPAPNAVMNAIKSMAASSESPAEYEQELIQVWSKLEVVDISDKPIHENVMKAFKDNGLSNEDIGKLFSLNKKASTRPSEALTPDIIICQKIVEKCFPLPTAGTTMTKIISVDQFKGDRFLKSKDGSKFAGCVAVANYYDWDKTLTSKDIIRDFSLDYESTPFSEKEGYVKLETELTEDMEDLISRPYCEKGGMSKLTPPQTGSGILGCEDMDKLVPEYHLPFSPNSEFSDGTKATIFDKDGNVENVYVYNKSEHKWELITEKK